MQMMTQRIRTIGFALLGGGRGSDGMPFPSPSTKVSERMKRLGAGGWGQAGDEEGESDPELDELIASDEGHSEDRSARGFGYHRVASGVEEGTEVTPRCEGYFELSVKSVEAVWRDRDVEEESTGLDVRKGTGLRD